MSVASVYDFNSYRAYMQSRLGGPHQRTGKKSAAADFLGCHSGYLTRVLKEEAHLSMEQADLVNQFFSHTSEEAHYFMLLVQRERAGTTSLKNYFADQIAMIRKNRTLLHRRLSEVTPLSAEDEARYYSHWYVSAIHVLLSIKTHQTAQALTDYLGLPKAIVKEILELLTKAQLAIKDGENYRIGPRYLYVGPDSPNLSKHHSNWRLRSIQAFSQGGRSDDIHFSAVLTLSYAHIEEYKELMRKRLEEDMDFFKASEEEGGFALCLDFFEINS